MEEELVQKKSILLDSLAILEYSVKDCGPEVNRVEQPEVWEKQLDKVYDQYFDIVARLEVMTSIDLKLERMEFDGKYYKLSAHILNSLMLPPLPKLSCDATTKPVVRNQVAPPHGGSSTVAFQAVSSPLASHSSCSKPPPKLVAPTAIAAQKPASSSSTAVPRDGKPTKPSTKCGSNHPRLSPDIRKPLSLRTDPVSGTISNSNCLRSRNHSHLTPKGQPTLPGQKQRQVSRQSRSASRPLVQQELTTPSTANRCLLDTAPRVLPRVPSKREELLLQLKDIRDPATYSHSLKLTDKLTAERAQLGHMREIYRRKVDALPQCVLTRQPLTCLLNSVQTPSADFEDSCRSESDSFQEDPDHSSQVNPTAILCTRLQLLQVCADIRRMFRQIPVRPSGQLFLRIWWRDTPELMPEAFDLSTVAHGVSNTLNPAQEPNHNLLAMPVPRRDSTEDYHIVPDEDSPLNVPCEPASVGIPVRRRTTELREISPLRDLNPKPPRAAAGLHMARLRAAQAADSRIAHRQTTTSAKLDCTRLPEAHARFLQHSPVPESHQANHPVSSLSPPGQDRTTSAQLQPSTPSVPAPQAWSIHGGRPPHQTSQESVCQAAKQPVHRSMRPSPGEAPTSSSAVTVRHELRWRPAVLITLAKDINHIRIRTPIEWTLGLARGTSRRCEMQFTLGKSRQSSGLLAQARGNRAVPGSSVKRNKASSCGFVEPRGWDLITGKYPLCYLFTRHTAVHPFQQRPHQLKDATRHPTEAPEPSIHPSCSTRSICSVAEKPRHVGLGDKLDPVALT